jgi:peroxiredoxin
MIGQKLPHIVFKTRVRDESVEGPNPFRWQDMTTDDYFANKRVAVFSLPGAFTPTCSSKQCPSYDLAYEDFKKLKVDDVYCITVNDAFVVFQWAKQLNLKNVKIIPDGNGDFTRRMGMLIDKSHVGFGYRSWRYSMVVNNGVVEKWFEEPGINDEGLNGDPYEVTDPDTMLKYLRSV